MGHFRLRSVTRQNGGLPIHLDTTWVDVGFPVRSADWPSDCGRTVVMAREANAAESRRSWSRPCALLQLGKPIEHDVNLGELRVIAPEFQSQQSLPVG